MKQRMTKEQWLELLTEQKQSGLSVAAFCRSKDIVAKNFYNNSRKARLAAEKPQAFVRAQLVKNAPAPAGITLNHGKTRLTLPSRVSPKWLASLFLALP